jgi:hypothetical protein
MRRSHALLLSVWLAGCDVDHLNAGHGESGECGARGEKFCASAATGLEFCSDFEGNPPATLESQFAEVSTTDGGTVVIEPGTGCAHSNALRLALNPTSSCGYARVSWERGDVAFQRATLGADMLFGESDAAAQFGTGVASITTQSTLGSAWDETIVCAQFLDAYDNDVVDLHTQRYQVFDDFVKGSRAVPVGVWTRLELQLDVVDAKPEVSIRIDGQTVLGPTLLDKCSAGGRVAFHVGVHCSDQAMTLRADNITFDLVQ